MMDQDFPMGAGPCPESGTVADLVERAFRYRGDVTVLLAVGEPVTGYLFNRNGRCSGPYAQLVETGTGREVTVLYQDITHIRFKGPDAAAASSRRFEDS